MVFKATMWVMVIMFAATVLNVFNAYLAMDAVDLHGRFQDIGLLDITHSGALKAIVIPAHKPDMHGEDFAGL